MGVWIEADWLSKQQLGGELARAETIFEDCPAQMKSITLSHGQESAQWVHQSSERIALQWDEALLTCSKEETHQPAPQATMPWQQSQQSTCISCLFSEVSRNDSCPDLPEIQNGWKTTSHIALVRGARITYQCDPGYDLVGRETLTCQLDLSWSSQPPFCEKSQY